MGDGGFLPWLKLYAPIFGVLVVGGVTWGQTQSSISELRQKVADQAAKDVQIGEISKGQARLHERTDIMLRQLEKQQEALQEILRNQRRQQ